MDEVHRVRLDGRAARFLEMLRDLGHLREADLGRVFVTLAEMAPPGGRAGIPEVRRAAAVVLLPRLVADPDGLLGEDWAILFP